jgi:hypothetical protein
VVVDPSARLIPSSITFDEVDAGLPEGGASFIDATRDLDHATGFVGGACLFDRGTQVRFSTGSQRCRRWHQT